MLDKRWITIVVWFLAAFFLSLGGAWATAKEFPGYWTVAGWAIVALAQGFVAWRAFVEKPEED